jgi:hypothetical protein
VPRRIHRHDGERHFVLLRSLAHTLHPHDRPTPTHPEPDEPKQASPVDGGQCHSDDDASVE